MRVIIDETKVCECGCGGCFGEGGTTFIGDGGDVVDTAGGEEDISEGWGGDIGDGGNTF